MKMNQLFKLNTISIGIGLVATNFMLNATAQAANFPSATTFQAETSIQKASLLLPAVQAVRESAFKPHEAKGSKIEGLKKLETIGEHPNELLIYQSKRPSKAQIQARLSLANKLGDAAGVRFSEKPQQISEHRIALRSDKDASASFEVNLNTGNFYFNAGLNEYRGENATQGLPTEFEMKDLMFQVLKNTGIDINSQELAAQHIGGLNLGIHDERGGTLIFEKFKHLRLDRQLAGLPVEGDARMIFQFGERAALTSMVFQWPTIESVKAIPSTSIQNSRTLKRKALSRLEEMAKKGENAELTKVKLVLYDDGQGTLEPAYHIVMERMIQVGEEKPAMIPYDFYLPISAKPTALFPDLEQAPKPTEENEQLRISKLSDN